MRATRRILGRASPIPTTANYKSATPEHMVDKDRFYLASLNIEYSGNAAELISNTSCSTAAKRVTAIAARSTICPISSIPLRPEPIRKGTPAPGLRNARSIFNPLLTPNGINLPGRPLHRGTKITNTQQNVTQEVRLQSTDPGVAADLGSRRLLRRQRTGEQRGDQRSPAPAIREYLWGETMLQAWGENLLPNGDDYINDTLAHDQQIALFADATYAFTDQLKLEAALRYARTHFDFANFADGPQNFGPTRAARERKDETPMTPKVERDLSADARRPDLCHHRQGLSHRRRQSALPARPAACRPPTPTIPTRSGATKPGPRTNSSTGGCRPSGSVYYIQWNNIQQAIYCRPAGSSTRPISATRSARASTSRPNSRSPTLHLEMTLGYNDARYTTQAHLPGLILARRRATSCPDLAVDAHGRRGIFDRSISARFLHPRGLRVFERRNGPARPSAIPAPRSVRSCVSCRNTETNMLSLRAGMTVEQHQSGAVLRTMFSTPIRNST